MRARRRGLSWVAVATFVVLAAGACSAPDGTTVAGSTYTPSPSVSESPTPPPTETLAPNSDESTASVEPETEEPKTEGPTPAVEPSAAPEESPEPAETAETPEPAEAPTAAPEPPPEPENLTVGMSGARVEAVQKRLVELGYWGTSVDGEFGSGTRQAVWAFQKAAGLTRDGIVGPRTEQALEDGVRPSAQSSSGHVIEIDVGRQLVLLVDDGSVQRILNASSGNGKTYEAAGTTYRATTRGGSFAVGRQVNALHESNLELGDMWRPKFFNGAIALHGSPSVPPWPASHGCVRVSNGAMNYVWDSWGAPPGTPVIVY